MHKCVCVCMYVCKCVRVYVKSVCIKVCGLGLYTYVYPDFRAADGVSVSIFPANRRITKFMLILCVAILRIYEWLGIPIGQREIIID